MDYNLNCRGPIWVIQKPNIKFTDADTISMKNTSPNSLFFPIENQSQNHVYAAFPQPLFFWPNSPLVQKHNQTTPYDRKPNQSALRVENTTKQPLRWKINQRRKNLYLLERRRNFRKSRGHFLNPKPLISRTPCLNPLRNPVFSVPTHSPY